MGIRSFIFNNTPDFIKKIRGHIISKPYPIIKNPNEVFTRVYKIKDNTWEDTYYPPCYNHCEEQHLRVFHPEQYIYLIDNALINSNSDVVLTSQGAYWDKYNDDEFVTWAKPCDKNVMFYNKDSVSLRRFRKKEFIPGKSLSLIGVWSFHWGHFMFQYLSKLICACEAGILNQPITILLVKDEDPVIVEIVKSIIKKYPQANLKYTDYKVDYECEHLFCMPSAAPNFNDHHFRLDYPYMIPKHVLDKLNNYVIKPLTDKIKNNPVKYDKIFLPRKSYRTLTNFSEIHDFFESQGFVDIEGANLSVEEKADIFYHAKEIVGLYGSSFQNLMFCNGARCMVLTNYKMSTDAVLYLQIRSHISYLINVTGQDESDWYHSNFTIPLEKVKKVYFDKIKE